MENEDYESKLTELELELDDVEIIETIKPIKKKRKPMTAEHKAKCMASLKKAREASQLKRGKKAKAKKIMKEKDDAEVDKILDLHIKSKAEKEEAKDKEISALKKKLDSLTLQDIIPKPPKVKPPPPPAEEDAEAEGSDMEVDLTPYTPPSAVRTPQPSVKVEPLAPIKVISNSIPSIRRHIVRPKMKPRM
tara:strand:- start:2059 stop:2631 length:573 start_codon:yes stop_codon:yes gene_type:complete